MITSLRKLAELVTPASGTAAGQRTRSTCTSHVECPVVVVPAPVNRVSYTAAELAYTLGVKRSTVACWIARGRRGVKLPASVVPQGRIFPSVFAQWYGQVNHVEVVIQ